jgi:tetratricopeptide (TPR) repeat protein
MGYVLKAFLEGFRHWERPAQVAFVLAVVLLLPAIILTANAPLEGRGLAIGGVMALVITAQGIFMWANRSMVTPFTRAQRFYLKGDFEAARAILEDLRSQNEADANALTLLGNTYRQMGQLSESAAILYEAVDKHPDLYFPIYGFGRTLLSEGDYARAIEMIARALELGAPPVVRFDLGEAYYRSGEAQSASDVLQTVLPLLREDPPRRLMATFLLHQLGAAPAPTAALVREGLPYWEANALRFQQTPYGRGLAEDVDILKTLI